MMSETPIETYSFIQKIAAMIKARNYPMEDLHIIVPSDRAANQLRVEIERLFSKPIFAPKILKSDDYYLRLTITGTENGINFIIEPGRWDPSTPCFTNLNPNILEGDLCMKVERSWSFEYKSNNVQLKIDDFLDTSDYCF